MVPARPAVFHDSWVTRRVQKTARRKLSVAVWVRSARLNLIDNAAINVGRLYRDFVPHMRQRVGPTVFLRVPRVHCVVGSAKDRVRRPPGLHITRYQTTRSDHHTVKIIGTSHVVKWVPERFNGSS